MIWLERFALIPLCLMAVLSGANAEDYPTRNVTIMVPFAPGGGTDLIARTLAQKLEERIGRSFIIESSGIKPSPDNSMRCSRLSSVNSLWRSDIVC